MKAIEPERRFHRTTRTTRWIVLASLLFGACHVGTREPPQPVDFAAPDLFGTSVKLSDFDGDVILVNFWASWCGPCQAEIPSLVELHRRYKNKGLTVLGVAMDDAEDDARRAARELGIDYTVVRGSDAVSRRFGGIMGFPTTFILDRHRVPVVSYPGLAPSKMIEEQVLAQIGAPS